MSWDAPLHVSTTSELKWPSFVTYHKISVCVDGIVKQPLCGLAVVIEAEDTAATRANWDSTFSLTFWVARVIWSDPNSCFIVWNTRLGRRLNQTNGSADRHAWGSTSWRSETTWISSGSSLLALLESSALNFFGRRTANGGVLLSRSQGEDGKDEEELLDSEHLCFCFGQCLLLDRLWYPLTVLRNCDTCETASGIGSGDDLMPILCFRDSILCRYVWLPN